MRAFLVGFIAATLGAPCFAANDPSPQSSPAASSGHEQQPLFKSIWRQDNRNTIVHLQSGLACDAQVGTFRRLDVYAYKASGLDVSCNYMDSQRSLITVYMTRRAANTLADDFAD